MSSEISKEEFCKKIRTPENCWIFENPGKDAYFLNENDNRYVYWNGKDTLYKFKDMKEYGEIWMSQMSTDATGMCTTCGLWDWPIYNTWMVYD